MNSSTAATTSRACGSSVSMVLADLDLGLIPLSTGRRWLAGRRPELYDILVTRFGTERDPRTARFTTDPVDI
ncbi:hypothetical protein AB0H34_02820 [Saccharopolyspora shandongensis]|uniref:hypothetical protein n=1 Tax=Saccharopolyspora shandongensis TaxID=418495 RepID=UPI0033DC89FD